MLTTQRLLILLSQHRYLSPGWWVKQDTGFPQWSCSRKSNKLLPGWQWRREGGDTWTRCKTCKFLPVPAYSELGVSPCWWCGGSCSGTAGCLSETPPQSAHLQGKFKSSAECYPVSPCISPVASRSCYTADSCRIERITLSEVMGQGAQEKNK